MFVAIMSVTLDPVPAALTSCCSMRSCILSRCCLHFEDDSDHCLDQLPDQRELVQCVSVTAKLGDICYSRRLSREFVSRPCAFKKIENFVERIFKRGL